MLWLLKRHQRAYFAWGGAISHRKKLIVTRSNKGNKENNSIVSKMKFLTGQMTKVTTARGKRRFKFSLKFLFEMAS
jgi:hypothetical protein